MTQALLVSNALLWVLVVVLGLVVVALVRQILARHFDIGLDLVLQDDPLAGEIVVGQYSIDLVVKVTQVRILVLHFVRLPIP